MQHILNTQMFDKEDGKKLAKLGIFSAISLALEAPKDYEDTRLCTSLPSCDTKICAKAIVQSVGVFSKNLSVGLYLPDLDIDVQAVYFNYKHYMKSSFIVGAELIMVGQFKRFPKPQLIHPKIVKAYGHISAIYEREFSRLGAIRQKYLPNIQNEGLPQDIANRLFNIHFPDDELLDAYNAKKFDKYLYSLKFAEIFNHLKGLQKTKIILPAKPLKVKKTKDFLAKLPFELTTDQIKTIEDISKDLTKNTQMKRVVIGDVGSGKTLVMLAATWLIAPQKTILMAPTTLLANQLYEQALQFIADVKTVLVTSSTNISKEELHEATLIIGTHALLYKELPKAELIIVDEQHRFGVNQRALIANLAQNGDLRPHYLQCSATPIPRTKALIDSQMVGVSMIKTLPFEKQIQTQIIEKSTFAHLLAHIDEQVKNGRQVAIIYPLVQESEQINYQSIEEGAPFWQKRYQNVFVTHGKDKNKEDVLEDFRQKGSILIATTVIEVGISLPLLDTIIIVGAERLGLASLHQLRGRVGRYGNLGHCYLYTHSPKNERLNEFCTIKDGFEVAELDLKYRNFGDLITGKKQSGLTFKYFDSAKDYEIAKQANNVLNKK